MLKEFNSLSRMRLPQKTHTRQLPYVPQISQSLQQPVADVPTRPAGPARLPLRPLEVGVGWHVGITRRGRPNEDSLVSVQGICTYQGQLVPFALLVVADGMGGHECGLEASRIAIQNMLHTVLQNIIIGNE
ncbi:MAG: hypothetical protein J2P37_18705, partial [Ktedonobacteraceae bacterium]|nr:hypothetical protein [Ktedonobacteraceae bacterium]